MNKTQLEVLIDILNQGGATYETRYEAFDGTTITVIVEAAYSSDIRFIFNSDGSIFDIV